MNRDHFWLTDRQFARIAPHLPTDTRGKPRVDDRRVISGIVHVLKSGARWVDAPTVYGPRKTLYNRYVRWAAKGVWVNLFHSLARAGGPSAQLLIDSSAVKAHRSASGGKGGAQSGNRPLARRTDDQDPCPDRRAVPPACFHADGRTDGGLHGWSAAPRTAAALPHPAWRQGLRHRRDPPPDRGDRRNAEHPAQGQPTLEELLLACSLPRSQRHRAHVLPPQGLPPHRHSLRPLGDELSRRRLYRGHRQLLVMSPDPKAAWRYASHCTAITRAEGFATLCYQEYPFRIPRSPS